VALIFAAPDLGHRELEAGWVLLFFVLAASAYAFFRRTPRGSRAGARSVVMGRTLGPPPWRCVSSLDPGGI